MPKDTLIDPDNPLMFQMLVGLEALDTAITNADMAPCDFHRGLIVDTMSRNTWKFVEQCTEEVKAMLTAYN